MTTELQEELKNHKKRTTMAYILILINALAAAAAGFFIKGIELEATTNTAIQSIAILLMLAVIPFSLKFYKKKFDEALASNLTDKIRYIINIYIIKLCANDIVMIVLALAYAATKDQSLLYCELICAIVILFFCKPDKLEIKEEETSNPENPQI
ncbi:MAG: hypothetical protein MJZ33_00790 [Paludibacteraceae bacterium]|nr:hypothetical protein [Paludibacteraceae bacterium]